MEKSSKFPNVHSTLPLYEQLMHYLRTAIYCGEFPRGSKMPAERQLCDTFSISRITVRHAIRELVNEGLLEHKAGKGTFVTYQKMDTYLMSLNSFTDVSAIHEVGITAHRVGVVRRQASKKESQLLQLADCALVCEMTRLYQLDKTPLCLSFVLLDAERYPCLTDKIEENASINISTTLEREYSTVCVKAVKEIEATPASKKEATLLQCSVGEILFQVTEVVYDTHDQPNYFSINSIRKENMKLTMTYDPGNIPLLQNFSDFGYC